MQHALEVIRERIREASSIGSDFVSLPVADASALLRAVLVDTKKPPAKPVNPCRREWIDLGNALAWRSSLHTKRVVTIAAHNDALHSIKFKTGIGEYEQFDGLRCRLEDFAYVADVKVYAHALAGLPLSAAQLNATFPLALYPRLDGTAMRPNSFVRRFNRFASLEIMEFEFKYA